MNKHITLYHVETLLNLLCLSITPITGQITYPDGYLSQFGRIL